MRFGIARVTLLIGLLSAVAASALAQAAYDSIETEGVRFGTGASIGAITEKMRITQGGLVGIGTQSPTATLQVSGSFIVSISAQTTTPSLYVSSTGKVGIGTSNPSATFHVYMEGSGVNVRLDKQATNPQITFANSGIDKWGIYNEAAGDSFRLRNWDDGVDPIVISDSNSVGVLNSNPLAELDVAGTISASGAIQVGASSLTCTAGVPGAIRYSGGNIQFCNGTSWATIGTSTAPGSSGDVIFNNGSGFGTDTGQLYWDDANNRLGIGTVSPLGGIDVSVTNSSGLIVNSSAALGASSGGGLLTAAFTSPTTANQRLGVLAFGARSVSNVYAAAIYAWSDGAWTGGTDNPASLAFYTTPVGVSGNARMERMRITSAGNVGIGTTTPTVALHVVGDIAYTGVMSDVSDRRMKRDIEPLADSSADRLMLLKPVTFRMKDGDDREYGFIAQDVQKVFPELVRDGDILSLNYVGLIAPVVKTVQRLKLENKEQGDQIDALAEQNRLLRAQLKEHTLEVRKLRRDFYRLTGAEK